MQVSTLDLFPTQKKNPSKLRLYYDALLGLVNQYCSGYHVGKPKRRAIQTIVNAIFTDPQGEVQHHSFTGGWDR